MELLPQEQSEKGNVTNQREDLILLLANMHAHFSPKSSSETMLDDRAADELLAKTFENYLTWCKLLGEKKQHMVDLHNISFLKILAK
uniref:Uncharacterized protein n=1 Tax=Oryza brachyantha TaxID=4533 RepID=J3LR35_ORYBR